MPGAFGYGQFIPSSFTRYSVDFNENGVREPYSWPDVLGKHSKLFTDEWIQKKQ